MDEVALPLARSTLRDVERAVDMFAPHCLVIDVAAVAGALVARRRGLPWASSAQPATLAQRELYETEVVREFARSRLGPLQAEAGLEPVDWPNWSPHLILVNAVRELVGDARLPPTVRLVGATFDRPRPPVAFPWHLLDDRPAVFVSLGTVAEHLGRRFLDAAARALADEPLQAVVATAPELLPDPPANFLVRPFVPQLELLRRVDAVVSHGGMNTVVEALAHGRPLVVAPIAYDQPYNASRVAETGAGIRVRFVRPRVEEVREAVRQVLAEPSYRAHAARVGAALRAAGGAAAAADALEELVAAHRPVARAGPA
jgi:UDP:flavonoid glycosyltransferase YjiC (YdhE family)